ncbi:hypothetical protein LCGC14_3140830, partial [marine sediment metagenome]
MEIKGKIKAVSGPREFEKIMQIGFLLEENDTWYNVSDEEQLLNELKKSIVIKGAEIKFNYDEKTKAVSNLTLLSAPAKSSGQDDITNFEDLLSAAHTKFKDKLEITTELVKDGQGNPMVNFEKKFALFKARVVVTSGKNAQVFEAHGDATPENVSDLIKHNGWTVWPAIRFNYDTINYDLPSPAPSPPSKENWLGTDDKGRDVLARLIYGFRISILFGLTLTILSSVIGVTAGAIQGYYGGRIDIIGQRFIEVWSGMPTLFLLIILASIVQPNFWWLLGITLLFGWMSLVGVVRAEFLRGRNFEYVQAARALGMRNSRI